MQRYGSIYVVTNTATGEQYVGQTRQKVARRWKCHINTANSAVTQKYLLAQAILKYGAKAFHFAEVFCAFDADALNSAEIEWIAAVTPAYNIAKGGAGHRGVVASPELCKARSERIKLKWADPVWRAAQVEKLKQIADTPEAVARGRAVSSIGSMARAKKLFCPELQCSFLSVSHAARHLDISHSGIRYSLANNKKLREKYTFVELPN